MMKTGPVSNGTGSLSFLDSLWVFGDCSSNLQITSSQMEHNKQEFQNTLQKLTTEWKPPEKTVAILSMDTSKCSSQVHSSEGNK